MSYNTQNKSQGTRWTTNTVWISTASHACKSECALNLIMYLTSTFTSTIHPHTLHLHIYFHHPPSHTSPPHLLPLSTLTLHLHIYFHHPPSHTSPPHLLPPSNHTYTPSQLGTDQFPFHYFNPIFYLLSRTSTHEERSVGSDDPAEKRGERKGGRVAKMIIEQKTYLGIVLLDMS